MKGMDIMVNANMKVNVSDELLMVENLVVRVEDKEIIHGLDIRVGRGETHIIMGKNGSGKSSLLNAMVKNPKYSITDGDIRICGESILEKSVAQVAQMGLFLSFQNAPAIAGLSISTLLKNSVNSVRRVNGKNPLSAPEYFRLAKEYCDILEIPQEWLKRGVNVGFSGGEKKRISMLEMLFLEPKIALLDEPDSGVDTDSVEVIARAVKYQKEKGTSFVIVSHYPKLIDLCQPEFVHIMQDGKIIENGGIELANRVMSEGFKIEG